MLRDLLFDNWLWCIVCFYKHCGNLLHVIMTAFLLCWVIILKFGECFFIFPSIFSWFDFIFSFPDICYLSCLCLAWFFIIANSYSQRNLLIIVIMVLVLYMWCIKCYTGLNTALNILYKYWWWSSLLDELYISSKNRIMV